MKKLPLLSTLLLLLFISACSSIPLKTMYHLAKADLMTVDPIHLSAATRVPNELQESKKGVQMTFSSWLGKKKSNAKVLKIKLEKVADKEKLLSIKPLEKIAIQPCFIDYLQKILNVLRYFVSSIKREKRFMVIICWDHSRLLLVIVAQVSSVVSQFWYQLG